MTKSLETKRSFLSVSRIVLAVLMCLLFTGCALLDIKDKGGMVNPDAVSEEYPRRRGIVPYYEVLPRIC